MSKEEILEVITEWKFFWMNQRQNDERDYKNYLNRASGVDANMKHHLATLLHKKLEESSASSRGVIDEAYRIIKEAKRKFAPHTTNSDADYWIGRYEAKAQPAPTNPTAEEKE